MKFLFHFIFLRSLRYFRSHGLQFPNLSIFEYRKLVKEIPVLFIPPPLQSVPGFLVEWREPFIIIIPTPQKRKVCKASSVFSVSIFGSPETKSYTKTSIAYFCNYNDTLVII